MVEQGCELKVRLCFGRVLPGGVQTLRLQSGSGRAVKRIPDSLNEVQLKCSLTPGES